MVDAGGNDQICLLRWRAALDGGRPVGERYRDEPLFLFRLVISDPFLGSRSCSNVASCKSGLTSREPLSMLSARP